MKHVHGAVLKHISPALETKADVVGTVKRKSETKTGWIEESNKCGAHRDNFLVRHLNLDENSMV